MSHIRDAYMEESPWINERYGEIGFVPSNIAHELVAIAEHQGSRAALGRLVPVNADCAELGGIYVLPEFRGLGISKEIVSYLLRQGMTYKKNSSRRLDRKFSGFTVFAGRRDSRGQCINPSEALRGCTCVLGHIDDRFSALRSLGEEIVSTAEASFSTE